MEEVKEEKRFKRFSEGILIIYALAILIGYLLDKFNIVNFSYKAQVIIGVIGLASRIIDEISTFNKKHKIISSLMIILVSYYGFRYVSNSLNIINTNYNDELSRTLDIDATYINFTIIVLLSYLKTFLIKAMEYIKTAQEEYENKYK